MSTKHVVKLLEKENGILHSALAERDETIQRFKDGLNTLAAEHAPYSSELTLTQTHRSIRFFCSKCRTPFPCVTFNGLRKVYGDAVNYPPIAAPYEALEMKRGRDSEDLSEG